MNTRPRGWGVDMEKKVIFLSQSEAERMEPIPGSHIISITDPDKPPATLPGWDSIYRESFYDGGYSETTIKAMKGSFRQNFVSYISSQQARALAKHIDNLVHEQCNEIYVHCYFGESRSGAIALYLQNKHHFTPNKEILKPNRTVYELLHNPARYEPLIQSYGAQHIEPKKGLIHQIWYLVLVAAGIKR